MDIYEYRAIIKRDTVTQGKTTYTTKRGYTALTLDSECIVGHVLAESPTNAVTNALKRLKGQYPEERGYQLPDTMRIEEVEETIVTEGRQRMLSHEKTKENQ